jgi:lysine decarboxylase
VTAEVVDYLRELTAAGARLHGAADPAFRTLRVLVRA